MNTKKSILAGIMIFSLIMSMLPAALAEDPGPEMSQMAEVVDPETLEGEQTPVQEEPMPDQEEPDMGAGPEFSNEEEENDLELEAPAGCPETDQNDQEETESPAEDQQVQTPAFFALERRDVSYTFRLRVHFNFLACNEEPEVPEDYSFSYRLYYAGAPEEAITGTCALADAVLKKEEYKEVIYSWDIPVDPDYALLTLMVDVEQSGADVSSCTRITDGLQTTMGEKSGYTGLRFDLSQDGVITKNLINRYEQAPIYSVTYRDGLGGTLFADETVSGAQGEATPAFPGSLARPGYVFQGWKVGELDLPEYLDKNYECTAQWAPLIQLEELTQTDLPSGFYVGSPIVWELELLNNSTEPKEILLDNSLAVTLTGGEGQPVEGEVTQEGVVITLQPGRTSLTAAYIPTVEDLRAIGETEGLYNEITITYTDQEEVFHIPTHTTPIPYGNPPTVPGVEELLTLMPRVEIRCEVDPSHTSFIMEPLDFFTQDEGGVYHLNGAYVVLGIAEERSQGDYPYQVSAIFQTEPMVMAYNLAHPELEFLHEESDSESRFTVNFLWDDGAHKWIQEEGAAGVSMAVRGTAKAVYRWLVPAYAGQSGGEDSNVTWREGSYILFYQEELSACESDTRVPTAGGTPSSYVANGQRYNFSRWSAPTEEEVDELRTVTYIAEYALAQSSGGSDDGGSDSGNNNSNSGSNSSGNGGTQPTPITPSDPETIDPEPEEVQENVTESDVPLQELPDLKENEETSPGKEEAADEMETEGVSEPDVPLAALPEETDHAQNGIVAEVPKTGVGSPVWSIAALASAAGLLWTCLAERRGKEEEEDA